PEAHQPATLRTRQLQRELEDCYSALMSATFEDETAGDVQALQARALTLEQALNQLELAASVDAAQDTAQLVPGLTLAPEAIQAALPADAVLVSYLSRGDEIMAFVV